MVRNRHFDTLDWTIDIVTEREGGRVQFAVSLYLPRTYILLAFKNENACLISAFFRFLAPYFYALNAKFTTIV